MSRRKHVLQSMEQAIEEPAEGQHIVRAVGSRGSNIMEVAFPDGRTTLCLLPAKFHKKLWIKKGNYLIVTEDGAEADGRVTGEILAVLFGDHVKQLKRMPGVWPPEFAKRSSETASQAAEQLAALGIAESDTDAADDSQDAGDSRRAASSAAGEATAAEAAAEEPGEGGATSPLHAAGEGSGSGSSSEDDLPPIPRFHNRKIIEYEISESESDDD
ncbi:hypothetical protein D9Q98_005165 [Chlorella vulgaris]|uniref:S1-like domain-containing protein n=1 Tax=Chlorella vulgaris TaxID=3077 RepID=A0A9D4YWW1_CHLVU|nr:hypothetical protein D9Q98_005165 [Chlorella vulgaris]